MENKREYTVCQLINTDCSECMLDKCEAVKVVEYKCSECGDWVEAEKAVKISEKTVCKICYNDFKDCEICKVCGDFMYKGKCYTCNNIE